MLRKLDEKDINKYINFAYSLALDITKSSYPTFTDGIKSKKDFINSATFALNSDLEEILLFENNNTVLGWTQYYYNEVDNTINIYTFLCAQDFNKMLIEFLEYINKKHPKIKVLMGFPSENKEACKSLINNGFKLVEQSYNNVLQLDNYVIRDNNNNVEKLDIKDFSLFKILHDNSDIDIYYLMNLMNG